MSRVIVVPFGYGRVAYGASATKDQALYMRFSPLGGAYPIGSKLPPEVAAETREERDGDVVLSFANRESLEAVVRDIMATADLLWPVEATDFEAARAYVPGVYYGDDHRPQFYADGYAPARDDYPPRGRAVLALL